MYDRAALDGAWDLVRGLDAKTREGLRVAASEQALQGEAGGVRLLDLAREAVALAQAGLRARARAGAGMDDEAAYLDVLAESVDSGRVQADRLLSLYQGPWQGDLAPVYETVSY
jgi:glutamate--cysteine ligase